MKIWILTASINCWSWNRIIRKQNSSIACGYQYHSISKLLTILSKICFAATKPAAFGLEKNFAATKTSEQTKKLQCIQISDENLQEYEN